MKRFIVLIAILFLITPVHAQVMEVLKYNIDLNEDRTADMDIHFEFTDEIKEVNVPLEFKVKNIRTTGGVCEFLENNILSCKPPSKYMVGLIKIDTTFHTEEIVQTKGNISYFHFDIPILWETEHTEITVKLPFRTALIRDDLRPLSPSGGDIGSDGRSVTVSWDLEDQNLGDVIPIRVRYEFVTQIQTIIQIIGGYWTLILITFLGVGALIFYRRMSVRTKAIYSVLTEPERIIVDILSSQKDGEIDQRKLVKLSGFSKAKVSRTVNSLAGRGIVTPKRIGRKNKIILRKGLLGVNYKKFEK